MHDTAHGDTSVLKVLFAHNAWANLKLLDFCEQLSDEQLDAQAIGCYGSIRATLWHIVGGEVSYVERVNGKRPPKPLPEDQFPGFAAFLGEPRSDGRLMQYFPLQSRLSLPKKFSLS